MKFILLYFITISLLQTNNLQGQQMYSQTIEIKIKVLKDYVVSHGIAYYQKIYKDYEYTAKGDSANEKRFDIELSIQNNSSKNIYIWLMTCSWTDNFLINNNYVFFTGDDCDSNYPTELEIKSGQKKVYKTTLIKSIKFDYPPSNTVYSKQVETTKLGLIVINDIFKKSRSQIVDFNKYRTLMNDKSKWKVIWSNPLYLLK
ncbi:MAG: hypothetical protein JST21_12215 [Bacteroidetes bacterium]|nr:hypothetical protein [Bacteroidota bacterium]